MYLVFDLDKSVRALLQDCTEDLLHPEGYSEYYFKMSSRRMRCKDVRWALGVNVVAFFFFFKQGYTIMIIATFVWVPVDLLPGWVLKGPTSACVIFFLDG